MKNWKNWRKPRISWSPQWILSTNGEPPNMLDQFEYILPNELSKNFFKKSRVCLKLIYRLEISNCVKDFSIYCFVCMIFLILQMLNKKERSVLSWWLMDANESARQASSNEPNLDHQLSTDRYNVRILTKSSAECKLYNPCHLESSTDSCMI